jgi:ATP-dependent exoDNAse (exonuclease V) beta subunit
MGGALSWLRDALGLDPFLGGPHEQSLVLDGLVQLDTNSAREVPRDVWHGHVPATALAVPLTLPAAHVQELTRPETTPDPHALQAALRDAVSSARSDEWRQLDGTRVHDAVARLLDAARSGVAVEQLLDPERGPWLTDAVRLRLEPVVASDAFRRLVALGARTEVPYVVGTGATIESRVLPGVDVAASVADVDSGRIDALAVLPDGTWWVVDWKSKLPIDPTAAWHEHGDQLRRYAHAAAAAGAPGTIVTLVPLDRAADAVTWSLASASAAPTQRAGLPASA